MRLKLLITLFQRIVYLMGSNHVDRLSNMPDEVLSEILSLMPTKFAVRTSILSKRWRYKWTLVTNIDIDDSHPYHDLKIFSTFVDRVLGLCKTTEIRLFRLRFMEMWVQKSSVSKWIDEAVRLNVSELDIRVMLLGLPLSLFTCKTLTKLRVGFNSQHSNVWDWPTQVNLPCLKTLDIAVFSNPSLNAFKLIGGCPVLESLSFEVDHRSGEEEYRFSIPTLKHMKLRIRKSDPINKVVLNVPNLEDLFISGWWCSHFVMEDFPSLVSVTFSGFRLTFDNLWAELLKGIIGVKSLTLIGHTGLPDAPFTNFPNLKHLELAGGWLKIFQFLERCSELEYLSIEEVREFQSFDIFRSMFNLFLLHFTNLGSLILSVFKQKTEQSCWIAPHSVPICILNNLATMKFENCIGRKDELQFLEYMLGNAKVLKTNNHLQKWAHGG
ncbi:FBD-like protein [Artemisia annua]|uniref:FBD-like protein n=1 Tax=Artemisia annua TaxID=35608 RepID=A0A2U1MMP1_ARTAN|nr:FBD-like protein [Artemisia annua]